MDLNAIAAAAAQGENQTLVNTKTERKIPEAGMAFAVLKDYIELGVHNKTGNYTGTERKLMLTFELNHKKHLVEGEPQLFTVRVNITNSEKGKFLPLFNALNYDNRAQHMTQLIGRKFLVELTHVKKGDKTYVNADKNGAWTFRSPIYEDPATGDQRDLTAQIPNLKGDPRVFIWENAAISDKDYLDMWNSVFIESNNFIQEIIRTNIDFNTSRLSTLLNGVSTEDINDVVNNVVTNNNTNNNQPEEGYEVQQDFEPDF